MSEIPGVVSMKEALTDYLEALAGPPITRWGRWTFDAETVVLRHHLYGYEIDLDRCTTSGAVLDWIFQLHKKTWMTDRDRGDLLRAFDDILNPQATLCPGGLSGSSAGRSIARDYVDAVKRHHGR